MHKNMDTYTIEILIKDNLKSENINKLTFINSNFFLSSNHIIISTPKENYTISNVYNLNNVKSYKILKNDN